ncbi:sialate O-acetylesterase [Acinetobacter baumannii]|nr:sialate O-acetylesterase [Acinetobacter baumannii]MDQ2466345.1 sialate O-acetylesterase [Acinetobacter baumannii]
MSNKVTTPYPLFSDIDGSPLNAGFLFLGESGKDPELFPIQVYWDKEKTDPAEQPIRTKNGYPSKNGIPSNFYVEDSSFSVTLKNRNQYLIASNRNFEQFANNSFVITQVETEKQRALLAESTLQTKIDNETSRATGAESTLNTKIDNETSRALGVEQNLQLQISTSNAGIKYFQTEAALLATTPGTTDPKQAYAFDTKKNYLWNGSAWSDEGKSPLDLSKSYTDEQFNLAVQKSVFETLSQLFGLAKSDDEKIKSLFTDAAGNVVIGYDLEKDTGIYAGMLEQVVEIVPGLKIYNDGRYLGLLADSERRILIGYDMLNDLPIIAGLDELINGAGGINKKPEVKAYNHLLFYGQSLSVGATATTILSTSQPYFNVTFDTGPRKDSAANSVIPLIEQFNNPSSDGYDNRGETCCSGAANYASRAMMLENGIDPIDHVIFASTAGHGGYRIDQLEKGTDWYNFFIEHVSEAKRLNGEDYKVQVVCWVQGENDAVSSVQTSYEIYRQKLLKLQIDASADIKAITGQTDEVKFITYQMSYAARTWEKQALVQLHLCQQSDKFLMATPMYHMPYAIDNIHLTNVGYKWLSAYFGRAYKQLIVDNRKPDFINPKVAQLIGDEIHIHFDVPKAPLVLDTTTLALTTDHGFKVLVNGSKAAISNIATQEDKVILKISEPPTGEVKVRYALDYLGTGINLTGGASGNLRDSTTDSIEFAGVERPLYHVCPHFELTVFIDKGI